MKVSSAEVRGMKDEWIEDPLSGYEENARRLFGYPDSTLTEYLRDLNQFRDWICDSVGKGAIDGDSAGRNSTGIESAGKNSTVENSQVAGLPKSRLIWLTCNRDDVERYLVHLSNRGGSGRRQSIAKSRH